MYRSVFTISNTSSGSFLQKSMSDRPSVFVAVDSSLFFGFQVRVSPIPIRWLGVLLREFPGVFSGLLKRHLRTEKQIQDLCFLPFLQSISYAVYIFDAYRRITGQIFSQPGDKNIHRSRDEMPLILPYGFHDQISFHNPVFVL